MAEKKMLPERAKLQNLDSLFGIDEGQSELVTEIKVEELFAFRDHPFKVLDDEKMERMVESIRENGILVPIMVREKPEGGYEVISGHRRIHAAKEAGLEKVPAIIRELDDDEATIVMVDSNLQREELLPSEKAFAYKMKLEAIKRKNKVGRPEGENSRQVGENLWSVNVLSDENDDSARTIQRYIRLTELMTDLLDMVDGGKVRFGPAVELSYLNQDEQATLMEVMRENSVVPSLAQAKQVKKLSQDGAFTKEAIYALLAVAPVKERKVFLSHDVLKEFFPENTSEKEINDLIRRLLEDYRKEHGELFTDREG